MSDQEDHDEVKVAPFVGCGAVLAAFLVVVLVLSILMIIGSNQEGNW